MARRFALFANPAAAGGRALEALPAVRSELGRLGAEHRLVDTRDVDSTRSEAAAAAADGETVVAIGGDGLVGCVAGALRSSRGSLAIVPAGRGNDFARALHIPRDATAATRFAVEGPERLVDVADVDGSPFVGIASVGFDSECNRVANETTFVKGNLVYLYSALRTLAGWKHADFEVTVDGERHEFSGFSVAVGNSKAYAGGMFVFPHAKIDDGRLDILMLARHSKLRFLANIPKAFRGADIQGSYGRFLTGEVVEVHSNRPFTVYADGDPIGELPVTVRISSQTLRVIAPERPER